MPDIDDLFEIGDLVRVKEEYREIQDADGRCWLVLETKRHAWLDAALCVRGNKRKWIGLGVLEKL
jgi:hypothetical protein